MIMYRSHTFCCSPADSDSLRDSHRLPHSHWDPIKLKYCQIKYQYQKKIYKYFSITEQWQPENLLKGAFLSIIKWIYKDVTVSNQENVPYFNLIPYSAVENSHPSYVILLSLHCGSGLQFFFIDVSGKDYNFEDIIGTPHTRQPPCETEAIWNWKISDWGIIWRFYLDFINCFISIKRLHPVKLWCKMCEDQAASVRTLGVVVL